MARKVYWDFLVKKLRQRRLKWVAAAGWRCLAVTASHAVRRPLCGPVLATVVTNYTCNSRCVMCDLSRRSKELAELGRRELTTAELKGVLDDLHSLGALGVGFTGGEPLLRQDIFDLLAYAHGRGFITHLNTNGSLVDEGAVSKILAAGVDSINISIDGARAGTHDVIRAVPGSFEKACRAVRMVARRRKEKSSSIRLKIVTVMSDANVDEIDDLLELAVELGADCSEFIPVQPFRSEKTGEGHAPGNMKAEDLRNAIRVLKASKKRRGRIENSRGMLELFEASFAGRPSPLTCFAGYNSIAVDNFGEIYPCVPWVNWGRSVGNIADSGLKEFWYSREYAPGRKEIARCRGCFLNCQAELNLLFQPWKL